MKMDIQNPPQKKICTFYLQGKCKFGNQCHFFHPQEIPSNNQSAPAPFNNNNNNQNKKNQCTFFIKNKCTNQNCPFFHGYENKLQHVKLINRDKKINNLIKMDETKFISCDEQTFIVHCMPNYGEVSKSLNKEGFKIGKMIFSGNKVIFGLKKEGR